MIMMIARRAPVAAWLTAVALLVGACGGGDAEPEPGAGAQPGMEDAQEADEQDTEEDPADVPTVSCEDAADDADASVLASDSPPTREKFKGKIPGHFDLQIVSLSMDGESLQLTYELAEQPTLDAVIPFSAVRFETFVDGFHRYSIGGYLLDDGGWNAVGTEYVEKGAGKGSMEELDLDGADISAEGPNVSLSVPLSALPELQGEFSWVGHVGGSQSEGGLAKVGEAGATDTCPDLSDDELFNLVSLLTYKEKSPKVLNKLPTGP